MKKCLFVPFWIETTTAICLVSIRGIFLHFSLSINLFQIILISSLEEKCFVQKHFIKYFFILLFLLCFVTPVLITFSLNVFITFAVPNTTRMSGALGGYAPTGGFSSSVNCIG